MTLVIPLISIVEVLLIVLVVVNVALSMIYNSEPFMILAMSFAVSLLVLACVKEEVEDIYTELRALKVKIYDEKQRANAIIGMIDNLASSYREQQKKIKSLETELSALKIELEEKEG